MAKIENAPEEATEVQAPEAAPATDGGGLVQVRITKKGDGQVSTGERDVNGDIHFKKDDTPSFPREIAEELEERGFAEI